MPQAYIEQPVRQLSTMTKSQAFAVFMAVVGLALIIWQAGWFVAASFSLSGPTTYPKWADSEH